MSQRERIDHALERAVSALNSVLDPKTKQVLPGAVTADGDALVAKLKVLEREAKRIRVLVEAAVAQQVIDLPVDNTSVVEAKALKRTVAGRKRDRTDTRFEQAG